MSATSPTIDESIERKSKALTLDQVKTLHYSDYLGADHGELAVVGDFEPSEILPIVSQDARRLALEESLSPESRSRTRRSRASERISIPTPDKANATFIRRP